MPEGEVDERLSISRPGPALRMVEDLAEVVSLAARHRPLFLRYSKGPEADRTDCSRDYEADLDLPGLSVTVVSPEPWWTRPDLDWVARRICKYDELDDSDRFPWLLTGEVVGYGPDHEPLVRTFRPVARVGPSAIDEARRVYEERFHVGRGSGS
jgi:hypothetical protein